MSEHETVRFFDQERSFWRALSRLYGDVLQQLEHELEPAVGLPVLALEALYDLREAPGKRLQLRQFSSRFGISRTASSRLVDKLEEAGHVRREVSLSDKRAVYAILTPAGEQMLDGAQALYANVLHHALQRHRALEGLATYTAAFAHS